MSKPQNGSPPDAALPVDAAGETAVLPAAAPAPAAGKPTITINLQNIPLLQGLGPEDLKQVASVLQIKQVGRGALILHKGGSGDYLLFMLAGRLQVVDTNEDGKEIGLSFILPGDYFGELSIVDGKPRSASVVACETSLIALLPRRPAQILIYHHPLVAERVLQRMAASVRQASSYRAILGIPNAFQRVFALLQHLSSIAAGGLVVIDQMPTQQEIAIMVNTSRETVSRALSILIKRDVVEKDLRRLIIRQPEILREAATRKDRFELDFAADSIVGLMGEPASS
jgi:CRP-like cAMP-binding protein